MKTNQFFKEIPEAPRYRISEKGEITNAAGYPVKAENGRVRLTVGETRTVFYVSNLIASAWKKVPAEPVSVLDVELPTTSQPESPAETKNAPAPAENEPAVNNVEKQPKQPKKLTKKEFIEKIRKADDDGSKYKERLTFAIAETIREKAKIGEAKKDLAAEYGVKEQTIRSILIGKIWKVENPRAKKAATTTEPTQ